MAPSDPADAIGPGRRPVLGLGGSPSHPAVHPRRTRRRTKLLPAPGRANHRVDQTDQKGVQATGAFRPPRQVRRQLRDGG